MRSQLRPALVVLTVLTLITGVAYPVLVWGLAEGVFPTRANGSVLVKDGNPVGSELIGQSFTGERYFWGRPSATTPAYNGGSSSGSNFGPTNPAHLDAVRGRVKVLRDAHPDQTGPVPVDLVTSSGSGLDPRISPASAEFQVARVARARGLAPDEVRKLVAEHTDGRTLGLLGEPRVHVLKLNLALDQSPKSGG